MPAYTQTTPVTLRIFWLRETGSGGWKLPFGCTLAGVHPKKLQTAILEMAGAPDCRIPWLEALCRDIYANAKLLGQPAVECHLPVLGRLQQDRGVRILEGKRVATAGPALLRLEPDPEDDFRAGATLLAAALPDAAPGFTAVFRDKRRLPAGQLLPCHHAGEDPRRMVEACWEVAMPASLAQAWADAPAERQKGSLLAYARVSMALQDALRRWTPYIHFSDLSRYERLETAWPLLVYQASNVYRPRIRANLLSDPIDRRTLDRCLWSARRKAPALLERVRAMLCACGRPDLASLYRPNPPVERVADLASHRNRFLGMLKSEETIVNLTVTLALEMQQALSARAWNCKRVSSASARFLSSLKALLRFHYAGSSHQDLAPLLLMEATAALAGRRDALRERLLVEGKCVWTGSREPEDAGEINSLHRSA